MSVREEGRLPVACAGGCLDVLLESWPTTGYDDAVRISHRVDVDVLELLLDFEREHSDRPRYRRLLRSRIDALRPHAGAPSHDGVCVCGAPPPTSSEPSVRHELVRSSR